MKATFKERSTLFSKSSMAFIGLSSVLALLGGCGGTGQDDGSAAEFSQEFSGLVIDGYLARATVFIDSNNNGTRDAWEPWAFTDNDGYYSFNPKTNTDYCSSDASAQEMQYCLVADIEYSNVVIRVDSGYDIVTGEPFLGQMSLRVNAQVAGEVTNSVVSPITSLLSNVESDSDRSTLLASLDITDDALDIDYLNTDGSGSVDPALLGTALKIHKVVTVLSDRLTDTYTEIGEEFGTPNDASSAVYPNLAAQIINSGSHLDEALSSESTLVAALDAAETSLRAVYERKEFDMPPEMGTTSNPGDFTRVVEVASEFSSVVNSLIDANDAGMTLDDAIAGTRALESLVIKTVAESSVIDNSIENVISFFDATSENHSEDLVDSLLTSLSLGRADITSLINHDFSGSDFDSVDDIVAVASLGEAVTAFRQIGGLQLRIADLDLGTQTDAKDSEVEFYFSGEAGDVDGAFTACVKFIDGANVTTGSLGEGNTRGELVEGFWSLLGATEGDVQSHSLLLTLTFLGTTYQSIMKPAGMEVIDNTEYQVVRFDMDGEIELLHSESGLVELTSQPTTNEACQERLPTRIGI